MPRAVSLLIRSLDSLRRRLGVDAQLSGNELRAISYIAEADGITPKNLAVLLELSTATTTFITTALSDNGLVERHPHPSDRRSLLLRLSPAGHELVGRIYDHFAAEIVRAERELDPEQVPALRRAMSDMAEGLNPHAGSSTSQPRQPNPQANTE